MPARDNEDARPTDGLSSGRLVTGLFWAGVALAPLATLLVLLGQGAPLARIGMVVLLATVLLIGLSIFLNRDAGPLRFGLEDLVFDEAEALRDELRQDLAGATRANREELDRRLQVLQHSVEQLQRQLAAAGTGGQAPPVPAQHSGAAGQPELVARYAGAPVTGRLGRPPAPEPLASYLPTPADRPAGVRAADGPPRSGAARAAASVPAQRTPATGPAVRAAASVPAQPVRDTVPPLRAAASVPARRVPDTLPPLWTAGPAEPGPPTTEPTGAARPGTDYADPGGARRGADYADPGGARRGADYADPGGARRGADYADPRGTRQGTGYPDPGGRRHDTAHADPAGAPHGTADVDPREAPRHDAQRPARRAVHDVGQPAWHSAAGGSGQQPDRLAGTHPEPDRYGQPAGGAAATPVGRAARRREAAGGWSADVARHSWIEDGDAWLAGPKRRPAADPLAVPAGASPVPPQWTAGWPDPAGESARGGHQHRTSGPSGR